MAALDPLGILNSDTQVGPDGVARRANEKVTRNYMQFGKYFVLLTNIQREELKKFFFEIRRQKREKRNSTKKISHCVTVFKCTPVLLKFAQPFPALF